MKAFFGEPLYGLVGGLHFPITGSAVQRIAGADRPPWKPLTESDVLDAIQLLKDRGLQQLALSPHDSCDWTLSTFEEAWGSDFQMIKVGQPIRFSGNGDTGGR